MKKIIMLLVSGAMAFGLAACSNDETMPTGNIKTGDQLYLPRNNASIELETNNDTHFEWEGSKAAGNGYVIYELLFDKMDGDFSEPLYVLKSDNNGYLPAAKVEAKTLNSVAKLAGADLGEQVTVKWTVRAWCGLVSKLYGTEAGARTMSITRVNSVDPLPTEVSLKGTITEDQNDIALFPASVIHTSKGTYKDEREEGAYEFFAKLTEGSFSIVDNLDRQYRFEEKGRIKLIKDGEPVTATGEISKEGIYWIYVNFSMMTYKIKEIQKVEFLLSSPGNKAELTYNGKGVWSIEDYEWNVKIGGNTDSRHKFICTYADGSTEYWGHFEDDCRQHNWAEKGPLFYNIFRHTFSDKWDNSWKTNEDTKEGYGRRVSFRLHMNNTDAKLFLLERSFSVPDDVPPTQVSIKGAATEGQAEISLNGALPILKTKGRDDLVVNREANAFECFTKLTAGTFTVTDGKRYFELKADNTIGYTKTAKDATISKTGIYWVYMNFNTNTWMMKEISKVEFWQRPWFGHSISDTAEMTYKGSGEWSIIDFAWEPNHSDGRKDTRYYFICTYADNTKERWAYYSDDCREAQCNNPENYPNFFNIYRFDNTALGNEDWADSWKTKGDSEGIGQKATFHVYMNNTQSANYKHTRSFK